MAVTKTSCLKLRSFITARLIHGLHAQKLSLKREYRMASASTEWQVRFDKLTPEKKAIVAQQKLRNIGCLYIHNIEDVINKQTFFFNIKTKQRINGTPELVHLVTKYRLLWDIELVAVGRDNNKETYIKHTGYAFKTHVLQSEIAEALGKIHYKYFFTQIPNHRVNMAWIGAPKNNVAAINDDAYIRDLLYNFGALRSTGQLDESRDYSNPPSDM